MRTVSIIIYPAAALSRAKGCTIPHDVKPVRRLLLKWK
jgi:hypothetical protein